LSAARLAVVVQGIAFWSSRLPGWELAREVILGTQIPPPQPSPRPAPVLLQPTERRRAPDTVALALEVAQRASAAAGRAPIELASVFASTHGDLAISDYMCATLVATPTLLSPIKFHNSVHNAAAGYWSIGTGSYASYTALSAYQYTFAAGLLEAATQVICDERAVLYVAFDVEAKGPLATVSPSLGLFGVALVLAPAGEPGSHRLTLELADAEGAVITAAQSAASALVAGNALANCLPLFEALALERGSPAQSLVLQLSTRTVLRVGLGSGVE
jgi:Beta-ketoacyl synthase, N-terminal domain